MKENLNNFSHFGFFLQTGWFLLHESRDMSIFYFIGFISFKIKASAYLLSAEAYKKSIQSILPPI